MRKKKQKINGPIEARFPPKLRLYSHRATHETTPKKKPKQLNEKTEKKWLNMRERSVRGEGRTWLRKKTKKQKQKPKTPFRVHVFFFFHFLSSSSSFRHYFWLSSTVGTRSPSYSSSFSSSFFQFFLMAFLWIFLLFLWVFFPFIFNRMAISRILISLHPLLHPWWYADWRCHCREYPEWNLGSLKSLFSMKIFWFLLYPTG